MPTTQEIMGPQPKSVWVILSTVALLMIVVAVFVPIINGLSIPYYLQSRWFAYLYCAGAVILLLSRFMSPYRGCVDRVKRLHRIEIWSSIFFCVGGFFLFYQPNTTRDWLAFTLAGGAIQIYTSIMIPIALRKALKENQ